MTDIIIIGAGMGGGIAARALTQAGWQVVLLEKGSAGHRREETRLDLSLGDPVGRALRGFWPDPAEVTVDGRQMSMHLPLGSGIGGSSVFYAATLERPALHDIEEVAGLPHPTGGWPVTWADLVPWFDAAQEMLGLNGTPDPLDPRPVTLRAPPAQEGGDRAIMAHLQGNGLHPYHLHSAVAHLPDCASCLGRKCPRPCKMDGRSAGVEPAIATGRLRVETGAEVVEILADATRATGVRYLQNGQEYVIHARHIVLAAGALSSPRVLLASRSDAHPAGLGNGRDQVGRNLMFHLNEMFAYWPARREAFVGAAKSVGFRDLYAAEGQRLGMVQAMGVEAGYPEILHLLRTRLAEKGLTGRLWREGARIPAALAAQLVGEAKLFVGLMEDLPDPENRVLLDPANPRRMRLTYTTAPEAQRRRRLFRRLIGRAFKGRRVMFLSERAEPNLGHGCGTLRMGHDPATSATDSKGRIHGMDNLWVADASVFPTSMGVNPSLTIAALALRQAQAISDALQDATREDVP